MGRPRWLDDQGRRVPTRPCLVEGCTREWAVRRYRFEIVGPSVLAAMIRGVR